MAVNVKLIKDSLRNEYKLRRNSIPLENKQIMDEKICSALLSLVSYRYCKTLLMYAPLKNEIDIMKIAERAINDGKRVAFPICNVENHTLEFKFVTSLRQLKLGSYSIREPEKECETVYNFSDSICIVPGIVFDIYGYRVGYGKGYYDRFLNNYEGNKIGCVYSEFILDTIPKGHFDRNVDIMVTEKGVKIANKSS